MRHAAEPRVQLRISPTVPCPGRPFSPGVLPNAREEIGISGALASGGIEPMEEEADAEMSVAPDDQCEPRHCGCRSTSCRRFIGTTTACAGIGGAIAPGTVRIPIVQLRLLMIFFSEVGFCRCPSTSRQFTAPGLSRSRRDEVRGRAPPTARDRDAANDPSGPAPGRTHLGHDAGWITASAHSRPSRPPWMACIVWNRSSSCRLMVAWQIPCIHARLL